MGAFPERVGFFFFGGGMRREKVYANMIEEQGSTQLTFPVHLEGGLGVVS